MDLKLLLEKAIQEATKAGDAAAHKLLDLWHEHAQAELAVALVVKKIESVLGIGVAKPSEPSPDVTEPLPVSTVTPVDPEVKP